MIQVIILLVGLCVGFIVGTAFGLGKQIDRITRYDESIYEEEMR